MLGEKMNELNELKKLFDEPKERISYEDWYKNKYEKDCNYMIKNFPEYWKEECDHLYLAWEIRKISVLSPMYLKNLIFAISEFNFKEVLDYMTKTNWYWGKDSKIPTIQEMISNVIELASGNKDGSEKNEGCSSGGFEVIRHMDDTVTIKFSFQYLG